MTQEETRKIIAAINDLAEAITFLHLIKMAAVTVEGQDGNALELVSDLADKRLMRVREGLYGFLEREAPVLKGAR